MARILAVDYGKKRVGLAVSDPGRIIATRLETVTSDKIWIFLEDYFKKEDVDTIVVGYPKQLNNEASEAIRYINPFLKKLQQKYPEKNLELIDERFTSKLAFRAMIDGGLKKQQRQDKALVDGVSATIILQNYLETERNRLK